MSYGDGYAVIQCTGARVHKKMLQALARNMHCSMSEVIRTLIEDAYQDRVGGELRGPTNRFKPTDGRVYPKDSLLAPILGEAAQAPPPSERSQIQPTEGST